MPQAMAPPLVPYSDAMSGIGNKDCYSQGHALGCLSVDPSSSSCPAPVLWNDPGTKKEQDFPTSHQGSYSQHLLRGSGLCANVHGVLFSQQQCDSDNFHQNQPQQQQQQMYGQHGGSGYQQQQRFAMPVQQRSYCSQPINSFQTPEMQHSAGEMQGARTSSPIVTGSASSSGLPGTCGTVSGVPAPRGGHTDLGPVHNPCQEHGVLHHHRVPFDPRSVQHLWQHQSSTAMDQAMMYQFQHQSEPLPLKLMPEAQQQQQQQQLAQLQPRMNPHDQASSSYYHGNDSSPTRIHAHLLQCTGSPAFVQPGSQDSVAARIWPPAEHMNFSEAPYCESEVPRGLKPFKPAGPSTHKYQLSASLPSGARPEANAIAAESSRRSLASQQGQQPTPLASENHCRTRRPVITRGQSIARTHSNKFYLPSKSMSFNQTGSIFSHGTGSAATSPLSELRQGNTSGGKDMFSATALNKAYVTAIRVHLCEGRELPIKVRIHHHHHHHHHDTPSMILLFFLYSIISV